MRTLISEKLRQRTAHEHPGCVLVLAIACPRKSHFSLVLLSTQRKTQRGSSVHCRLQQQQRQGRVGAPGRGRVDPQLRDVRRLKCGKCVLSCTCSTNTAVARLQASRTRTPMIMMEADNIRLLLIRSKATSTATTVRLRQHTLTSTLTSSCTRSSSASPWITRWICCASCEARR